MTRLLAATLLLMGLSTLADTLRLSPDRHAFFAEQAAVFQLQGATQGPVNLRLVHEQRTLWSQHYEPAPVVSVQIPMPTVKPGVIMSLSLQVTLGESGVEPDLHYPLYVFSRELVGQAVVPSAITIYGPDAGQVAETLGALGFEVQQVTSLQVDLGDWLICTGLRFDRLPSLYSDLLAVAAGGTNILVIPPFTGNAFWQTEQVDRLTLAKADHLQTLDKRLDTHYWSAAGPVISHTAEFSRRGAAPFFRFQKSDQAWAWIETARAGHGITVCGFDIMTHIDENPSALWLLLSLLQPDPHTQENSP